MATEIDWLLDRLDEAYDRKAWHGPNLRGSIRRVDASTACWRPSADRRNIAEIVVHAAYWKYAVRRRLRDETRGSFPRKGSNWFPQSGTLTETQWRADVALLDEMHRTLREAIAELSPEALAAKPPGGKVSRRSLIAGIAFHDVYHAGQIQLLKRLAKPDSEE